MNDIMEIKYKEFEKMTEEEYIAYRDFHSELTYLTNYLDRRILPAEREEVEMRSALVNLANALDNELELIIKNVVKRNQSKDGGKLVDRIENGFCSFKIKFEWVFKKGLITKEQRDMMEEIRILRNTLTHYRRSKKRPKYTYKDLPLMCGVSLRNLFLDCNSLLISLKNISGNKIKWDIIPPGYAEECWGISKKDLTHLDSH